VKNIKKIFLQFLLFITFVGSIYWIYKNRTEVEPYVVAIASLATFIGSFIDFSTNGTNEPLINVELVKIGHNKHRFIISNTSQVDAYDIDFELKEGQKFPIPQNTYKETFPIKNIFGGDYVEVIAALSYDSGISFDLTWRWKNKKGKSFFRANTVSLKS
jgi:hypothetical protein